MENILAQTEVICAEVLEALKSCPAFVFQGESEEKLSCPFRAVSELQDIGEVIAQMPKSHNVSGSAANLVLHGILKAVHAASTAESERLGGKHCPIFAADDQKWSFKTSDERPVLLELEARAWPNVASASEELSDVFLSKLLKMGTQMAHKAAESGTFVKRLLRGRVPPEEYRLLVVDLCHVYEALESSLEAAATVKQCRIVQAIHKPAELNRLGALQRDFDFWFRGEKPSIVWAAKPSKPAQAYAARIRELVETAPHLLVAHAYTRYLGDLSGGAVIKRSICRAMPVGRDGGGVEFYDFENVPDAKTFKQKYRDQLDCLDLPTATANEIVAEANKAFDFNAQIFDHLDELAGIEAAVPEPEPLVAPGLPLDVELPAGHPPVRAGSKCQCPFAAMAAGVAADEKPRMKKQAAAGVGAVLRASSEETPSMLARPKKTWKFKAAGAVLAAAGAFAASVVPLPLVFGIGSG